MLEDGHVWIEVLIDYEVVASLSFLLNEESAMPYFFDIVHYNAITDRELLAHIDRAGKNIYPMINRGLRT